MNDLKQTKEEAVSLVAAAAATPKNLDAYVSASSQIELDVVKTSCDA